MCGICGQFNFALDQPVDLEEIKKMTRTMVHRGPDDEGYYLSGSLGLGFRRLAIIDLEGGRQPMADLSGSVRVVFNGEIYNFQELRQELEGYGHVFRTNSDTEVIVNGYRQWNIEVLDRLNGMFGLAIWDEERKQLMLARDRLGIKPLYYKIESGRLLFGSEIRPLLAVAKEKPALDPTALNLFLRFRYTPSPFEVCGNWLPGRALSLEGIRVRVMRDGGSFNPSHSNRCQSPRKLKSNSSACTNAP